MESRAIGILNFNCLTHAHCLVREQISMMPMQPGAKVGMRTCRR